MYPHSFYIADQVDLSGKLFVFERSSVWFTAKAVAILTEISHLFPQTLQAYVWIVT
jgi:hypothetical protein